LTVQIEIPDSTYNTTHRNPIWPYK